jgi:choline kinase
MKKAIIVAAGMGRRLAPYTDEMPKCLVPVRGRPILARQLAHLRAHGVDDVTIVRGYKADVLEARRAELDPVTFIENPDFRTNNILQSFFCAESRMDGGFFFSYADIVFAEDVAAALARAEGDFCLIVDEGYAEVYEGRTEHPFTEAEVTKLAPDGSVAAVGKRAVPVEEAIGEFIGLAKFSAKGASVLREAWAELQRTYAGREEEPFVRAPRWRVAYLTDLLQWLIDRGVKMTPVMIRGRWREIDTVQDLQRANDAVDW